MNQHDYETLMRHGGAHPAHTLTTPHPHAHEAAHPALPPPAHASPQHVHVVHEPPPPPPAHTVVYRHPAPPAEHVVHEVHEYHPSHHHAFEHEPPAGYSRRRSERHDHHEYEREREREHERIDEEDRRRRRKSKYQTSAEDIRTFPIGFRMAGIAPGTTEDIEVKPQVRFQGRRLAIAPSIARYFDVMDIKVGKDSQLAATGPLSGEALSALAVDVRVELDPAPPGIVITVTVQNNDTVAHDFRAVLYGLAEEVDE